MATAGLPPPWRNQTPGADCKKSHKSGTLPDEIPVIAPEVRRQLPVFFAISTEDIVMNRNLLWRDMLALSKDLHSVLKAAPNPDVSLQSCITVVADLNKRFVPVPQGQPEKNTENKITFRKENFLVGKTQNKNALLLGHIPPSGFLRKKKPVYLDQNAALGQVMLVGCTGAGRTDTLLALANNAANPDRGVVYLDSKGDNSIYKKVSSHLLSIGRIADLRVINLMTGGRDIDPVRDNKITHTIDLFHGMDWRGLSDWMQDVAPQKSLPIEQKANDQLLSELCPAISRLIFWWSIHTSKKITPKMVAHALTYTGLRECFNAVPEKNKAGFTELLTSTKDPEGPECAALLSVSESLSPLHFSYAHVFESDRPEVSFVNSMTENHFVLILAPAMEKSPVDLKIITNAIVASLFQAVKKQAPSDFFNHLVVLDDFEYSVNDALICEMSNIRDKGVSVFWGGNNFPLSKDRARWGVSSRTHWCPPNTHIVMLQCGDCLEKPYLNWQASVHPAVKSNFGYFKDLGDFSPGEAVVYSGSEIHKVWMDYKDASRLKKTFLLHANPLAQEILAPPVHRTASNITPRDMDKQAIVLYSRLMEFNNNKTDEDKSPKLSWCQETLARMMGFSHWHEAKMRCKPKEV